MVKEIRPITFVRDLRNEFNKRFEVSPEPTEDDAPIEGSKERHPASYRGGDAEGEALDAPAEQSPPVADPDMAAPPARRAAGRRPARD